MEHARVINRFITPGSYRAVDDCYRAEHIRGNEMLNVNFGHETYYGQDFIFKTESGRIFTFGIPYPISNKLNPPEFAKKKIVHGYNSQAAVDVETMLIVAADVSQQINDKQQIEPMLADTGYFSADNVKTCSKQCIEPLIAMGRDSHHLPLAERLAKDAPAPKTDDPLENMAWYLKTKEGTRPATPSVNQR